MTNDEIQSQLEGFEPTETVKVAGKNGMVEIVVKQIDNVAVDQIEEQNFPGGKVNSDGLNTERWIAACTGFTLDQVQKWPPAVKRRCWRATRRVNGLSDEDPVVEAAGN